MAAITYTNDTSILENGVLIANPAAGNPITVAEEGIVLNVSGGGDTSHALQLENGSFTVTVNGMAGSEVLGGSGISLGQVGTAVSRVTVGESGWVYGADAGVITHHVTNITNSGLIHGDVTGLDLRADGNYTITNNAGAVISSGDQTAISISGNGTTGNGIHTILNSGEIIGNIDATYSSAKDPGIEKITNKGYIGGSVLLGFGDDTVTNSGDIDGTLDLGEGKNTVTNSGFIGQVNAGGETASVNITNNGDIQGSITLGGGDDTIVNTEYVGGSVETFDGNDKVTNSGTLYTGLHLGQGNNTLKNSGIIEDILAMGAGNDTITNSGTVTGFDMADGANVLTNTGTITGGVLGGIDVDKVTNSGVIEGQVSLGTGSNTLTNTGTIEGLVFSFDDETAVNTILNSGKIVMGISLGASADVVKITGKGVVEGSITLGDGSDKLEGGAGSEEVIDQGGADNYKLGGGHDTFVAYSDLLDPANGDDYVDGGLGIDTYDVTELDLALTINLNATAVTAYDDPLTVFAARTAVDDQGFGILGKDTVVGFENVQGGLGDDTIIGNELVNVLFGSDGSDTIYGLAGNDVLAGDAGADALIGGRGRDFLSGGGEDTNVDRFVYLSAKDSTLIQSGRDVISDFEDGVDLIDFSHMSTAEFPNPTFWNFIGYNVKFTAGDEGQTRVLQTGTGWMIQSDLNGDKKADFAIEIADAAHTIVWGAEDFDFGGLVV